MIFSKRLVRFKEIVHGFTTKEEADFRLDNLRQKSAIARFCQGSLVVLQQAHQDKIKLIDKKKNDGGIQIYKGFDGLITMEKNICLGVHTADCLAILFYEPVKKIIAAVHAGWQGTLLQISQKMITKIKILGGETSKIIVAIGPHIGMCCYDIDQKRAELFEKKFGQDLKMISFFEGKPHLDLAYVNFLQLVKLGVKRENIDSPPSCTSCNKDLFFSYRRSKKEGEKYGEMLSFVGLI